MHTGNSKATVKWKNGHYVVLKLKADLFTIAQMRNRPVMRFFDICSSEDTWDSPDLSQCRPLFQAFVGMVVQQRLATRKIVIGTHCPTELPHYWIAPYTSFDRQYFAGGPNSVFFGGRLIDLGPGNDLDVTLAPVIKHSLSVEEDREAIERFELTNMWGSHDLQDRLIRHFTTSVDRDDLKFEVFPDLWPDRQALSPLTRRLPEWLR
ncbi:TPA: hypothetical protein ACKPZV_000957 [Stenotrophomonas maltophilia]|uniref:hypothetical protein n=1 Tax=Stenotrophomonas sp. AR026 TaxID=3398462 RepID=UPI0038C59A1F